MYKRQYVGRLTFFRVYSGKIEAGSYISNSSSGKKERVSRLFQMHSNKQNPVEVIGAGDIGAHHVGGFRQEIDHFALAFVAPLGADNNGIHDKNGTRRP